MLINSSPMSYTYKYPRPSVTVDIIVFCLIESEWKILLINRGREPFINMWALPGGFVDIDEDLLTAARRELKEETNLSIDNLTQFGAYGDIGRDPRGRTISIVYYAKINKTEDQIIAGDDAKKAGWFSIRELPGLAFDHYNIINDSIEKLKIGNK